MVQTVWYDALVFTAHTDCYLSAFAGYCILDQALLAKRAQEVGEDHYDYPFYSGKVAAARYYL